MKNQKGFSLIELLIVVAIILIIAAIAIPSLLRARISANESAMTADIRTVVSAEQTFMSVAAGFGDMTCLYPLPTACHTGAGTMPLVDSVIGNTALVKGGYGRLFQPEGPMNPPVPPNYIGGSYQGFCYGGTPSVVGRSGLRGFAGDASGTLVYSAVGGVCCVAGQDDFAACQTLGQ